MELPERQEKTGLSLEYDGVTDEQLLNEVQNRTYFELLPVEGKQEICGRKVFPGNLILIIRDRK